MMVAESMDKLSLEKDKLEPSKSEEKGVCEKDHKKDNDDNNNNDDSGNGKPRVVKKKPNKKRDKLKYFLCDGPHMLKKCSKKSELSKKEKSVGKALRLGLNARGVEAKDAESEMRSVDCFLCHGPPKLRKYPKKSVIEGDNRADNEPKKLSSSKGKVEVNRAKMSKKNEAGTNETQFEYSDELAESSARLSPMEEQERNGPFEVLKQGGRETVGNLKPSIVNQEDSVRNKLEYGQERNITSYRRDVQTSGMVRVKKRRATRALREWVGENVTGRSSKPVTIAPNVSNGGLLLLLAQLLPLYKLVP
ncbi:hypothetical protein Gotur_030361 [Gossypium turneri]